MCPAYKDEGDAMGIIHPVAIGLIAVLIGGIIAFIIIRAKDKSGR
jgi:hypothetical protein